MAYPRSRFVRAGNALFIIVFAFAGCGAFLYGLALAASADCAVFAPFLLQGVCERTGELVAALPFFLIGIAFLAVLVVVAGRLKDPPPEPRRPPSPGWNRFVKITTFVMAVAMIVEGVHLSIGGPCSAFLNDSNIQYRSIGLGLAKLCEMFGPAVPASLFILVGVLLLFGLYKGVFDPEK